LLQALCVASSSAASSPTNVRPSRVNVAVHFLAEPELHASTAANRKSEDSAKAEPFRNVDLAAMVSSFHRDQHEVLHFAPLALAFCLTS
jgi:hypothetical protein